MGQQRSQALFVDLLDIGIGQALPVLGRQLACVGQRLQLLDGFFPVAQLFGEGGPGQAQDLAVPTGRQLVEPVQRFGGATKLGQAQAVGLPQLYPVVAVAGGQPLFHLAGRWRSCSIQVRRSSSSASAYSGLSPSCSASAWASL